MRRIYIWLLTTMLIATSVNALGFGMIVNQDYGDVAKGETYTRNLQTWAFDTRFYPYTDNVTYYDVTVEITNDDPFVTHPDEIISTINTWSYTPIVLTIPINAKKGSYSSQICAIAIYSELGGNINVGVCINLEYNIVPKGQIKSVGNLKSGKIKWKNK